jgi:PAS domain S-box-containing protein
MITSSEMGPEHHGSDIVSGHFVVTVATRDLHGAWVSTIRDCGAHVELALGPATAGATGSAIVILDCDGAPNLAAVLRQCRSKYDFACIVVGSHWSAHRKEQLLREGAVACIGKGDLGELAAVLHRELERVRLGSAAREERRTLELDRERLRDLIAVLPASVWEQRFDVDDVPMTLSPSSVSILSQPWSALTHDDDRERIESEVAALKETGGSATLHYRLVVPDSGTLWLETHLKAIEENGRVTGLRGVTIDVTDKQSAHSRSATLARAFEATSDMVIIIDQEERVLFANGPFLAETGWEESEIIGLDANAVVAPDWLADGTCPGARRSSGVRRDGSTFPCLARSCVISGNHDEPVGRALSATNMTEFMQKEEQLLRQEEKLRHLAEAAFDGILVHDAVRIVDVNQAGAKMFGIPAEELVGREIATLLAPGAAAEVAKRLDERQARYEVRLMRADGTIFDAEVSAADLSPGATRLRVAAIRDITERKAVLEALRSSEEKFRSLSQAAFDGIMLHEGGTVVEVNDQCAAMFRCSPSELLGRNVFELTSPDFHPLLRERIKSRSNRPFTSVAQRPDGSTFPVEVCGVSQGDSASRVVALRDMTEQKSVEDELRRREERFRILAQAAFDGIVLERDGFVGEVNETFAEMFGYAPEELNGVSFGKLIVTEEIADGCSTPSRSRSEGIGRRKDGTAFALELCVATTSDGQNIYAIRDVTRERLAEQHLIESERRYRDLSESTHDLLCEHDLDGRIIDANTAAARAIGYSREELSTINIRDFIAPEFQEGFDRYIEAIQRNGVAEGLMTVITRDGERRMWHFQNALRTSGVDRPVVRGLARDVTEREMAVKALRKSEEHFRSIIENISDLICILDDTGQIVYSSPSVQRTLGFPSDRVVWGHFAKYIHPDDIEQALAFFNAQIADVGSTGMIDARVRYGNGSWHWLSMVSTTRVTRGVVTLIVNARDMTDRRLLMAQLEQANRVSSLGRLAATVAHEFNNVLMGMLPFAELMQRPTVTPEVVAKGAGYIVGSIARGKRVALDILRFTQPAQPTVSCVNLAEWWERLAPELRATLGDSIALEASVPNDLGVTADAGQLAQILTNLTSNARDAMQAGGLLTVSARRPRPEETFRFGVVRNPHTFVQITVADTGSGMTAEVVNHAFDPLFTTKQNGGTGLGLAVVHQIVSKHGGSIFIESQLGKGTTFHLFIPSTTHAVAEVPAAPTAPELAVTRVLIIDDDDLVASGLVAIFEEMGVQTMVANTAAEGMAMAVAFAPDVAVVDVSLPDADGFELGARLRQHDAALKIVFASGHADARLVPESDAGMAFLQKPFGIDHLIDVMVELGCGVRP